MKVGKDTKQQGGGRVKKRHKTSSAAPPGAAGASNVTAPVRKLPRSSLSVSPPASARDSVNQEANHSGWHPIHLQPVRQHFAASLEEPMER